jgi:hypothetical protein
MGRGDYCEHGNNSVGSIKGGKLLSASEVRGLERGPLSLVRTIEELLE